MEKFLQRSLATLHAERLACKVTDLVCASSRDQMITVMRHPTQISCFELGVKLEVE